MTAKKLQDNGMEIFKLDFRWKTFNPFFFCSSSRFLLEINQGLDQNHLAGRPIGQDFQTKDGFRMYHEEVPGF